MKIKKGDTVKMLYGKDSGKTGKVLSVLVKKGQLVVDGLNTYTKHIKGDNQKKKSEIVKIVKPVDISKVQLICPSCGKPTIVKYEIADNKKSRICKKCTKKIDKIETKSEKKEEKKTEKQKIKKVSK